MYKPTSQVVHSTLSFQQLDFSECSDEFRNSWRELEHDCAAGNVFLSPDYLGALLQAGMLKQEPIVFAMRNEPTGQMLGVTVLEKVRGTKFLPLPHLISLQSPHVYRSGIMVRSGYEQPFFDQMVGYVSSQSHGLNGIEFKDLDLHSPWVTQLLLSAQNVDGSFRLYPEYDAPVIDYTDFPEEGLESMWSSSRRKTMRRNRKKLSAFGEVTFRTVTLESEVVSAVEQFLKLEKAGWKGEQGTALACSPQGQQFMDHLLTNCLYGNRLVVTQLLVDDQIAATALNLRSGDDLFAFKISWDDRFQHASPGALHEIELANHMQTHSSVLRVDGCTRDGSYLEQIWPQRNTYGTGILSTTMLGRGMGRLLRELQLLKRKTVSKQRLQD